MLAGLTDADRVDVALVKYDRALGQANQRSARCADWYDRLKESRNLKHGGPR